MNVFHQKFFPFCGLIDSFGSPTTHFPGKRHPRGVLKVWLGSGIQTSANFLAAPGTYAWRPASRKVALNPGCGFWVGG